LLNSVYSASPFSATLHTVSALRSCSNINYEMLSDFTPNELLHFFPSFPSLSPLTQRKRFFSATNQQQLDCLLKHIENSQKLNLWSRQTKSSVIFNNGKDKHTEIETLNSSPPITHRSQPTPPISITKNQNTRLECVVLPVFVDIVRLALKAREHCSARWVD
jgi:hypothetical protein